MKTLVIEQGKEYIDVSHILKDIGSGICMKGYKYHILEEDFEQDDTYYITNHNDLPSGDLVIFTASELCKLYQYEVGELVKFNNNTIGIITGFEWDTIDGILSYSVICYGPDVEYVFDSVDPNHIISSIKYDKVYDQLHKLI